MRLQIRLKLENRKLHPMRQGWARHGHMGLLGSARHLPQPKPIASKIWAKVVKRVGITPTLVLNKRVVFEGWMQEVFLSSTSELHSSDASSEGASEPWD